jgi:hypothetical protein
MGQTLTCVNINVKLDSELGMSNIFNAMSRLEKRAFQADFARELRRLVGVLGAQTVYDRLGMTRENGRQCQAGRLPSRKAGVLKSAVELGMALSYKGQPLTTDILDSFQNPMRVTADFIQLELFTEEGLTYEINRKRAAREITVEIKIRRA